MEPLTLLVLSVAVFAVPLAVAFVVRRYRRACPNPARHRLRRNTWLLFGSLFVFWPCHLIAVWWPSVSLGEWPPRGHLFGTACWLLITLGLLRSRKELVRKATAESAALMPLSEPAVPSLRFHLALIFLPVLVLAIVGLVALSRDRAAVEAEARRRAGELAQELAARLSTRLPGELTQLEFFGNVWIGDGVLGLANVHWPTEAPVAAVSARSMGGPPYFRGWQTNLQSWRTHYEPKPERIFPIDAWYAADGSVSSPPSYDAVPRPAAWVRELSIEAAAAWESVREAEADTRHPERLPSMVQALAQATRASGPNRQAEFLLLRHAPADSRETFSRLLGLSLAAIQSRNETENGLPLGVLAFAEAYRRAPEAKLDHDWFKLVRALTVTQPSCLTPWVLDRGVEMAHRSGDAEHLRLMAELRARWDGMERVRELAIRVTEQTEPTPPVPRNLWLTNRATVWFAAIQTETTWIQPATERRMIALTNHAPRVRLYSADTLELAAFRVFHTVTSVDGREIATPPRLPVGLKLSLDLEGRRLRLPVTSWTLNGDDPLERSFAEATLEFRQIGDMPDTAEKVDYWPSRPRLTVRVHLADPAALFAAQRRQQWLFGGMILSVAGIAGLGGWQANRAFRRQLALSEEKSNFVSSVSHELRAPLASMRLLAEGLAEGRVTEESKRREYAGFLVQETRRLGSLVENVLDFARIEQGSQRYDFEPTDVGRLVRETVKLLQPRAAESGIGLTCPTDETASAEAHPRSVTATLGRASRSGSSDPRTEIACDGPAIQRALLNLLDNAFKHAPVGSAVTVTLGAIPGPRSAIFISVADSGPGIPAEDQARIFERFYRRGSELRRETQGVGLGLAIVKHIVEAHGGRVRVASTVGHGATFTLELPADPRRGSDQ
jgi:signal transduction histidine kinase